MRIAPIRSFNINRLLKQYKKVDDGLIFSADKNTAVDFGTSSDLTFGLYFGVQTTFTTPNNIDSGKVYLIESIDSVGNRFDITLESGLILNINTGASGNYGTLINSGLNSNTKYSVHVTGAKSLITLYVDGNIITSSNINISNFWPVYGDTSVKTRTDGVNILIEDLIIWDRPAFNTAIYNAYLTSSDVYTTAYSKGYWKFYNRETGIVIDNSSNGNHGFINAPVDSNYSITTSPAWKLTANSKPYINNSTFPEYVKNRDRALSVEGWVYLDEDILSESPKIVWFRNNGDLDNPFLFSIETDRSIRIEINDRFGNYFNKLSTQKIPLKSWSHLAFSFEAGSTAYSFSIDGNIENGVFSGAPAGLNLTTLSGVFFGDTGVHDALFRNWRIYEIKLTNEEIAKTYKYTTEYPVSQQYLIADWKFQEESTGWAYDCSDHGNYLYPITNSGLGSTQSGILASYVKESGFYPEMWDGYSIASTATDIYGDHILNVSEPNLIFNDNSVLEVLFFDAYDDSVRGFLYPDLADAPTNSFPLGIFYGPYVIVTNSTYTYDMYHYVYHSGLGIQAAGPTTYVREIPHSSASRLKSRDGKWHHIIGIHSITETISGTNYNTAVYHNGKLSNVTSYFTYTGIHALNTGNLSFGHYLNGAVAMARVYSPTTSGINDWLSGNNVIYTPGFSVTNCVYANPEETNLLFDAYLDYDNQVITNKSNAFSRTYSLRKTHSYGSTGVAITKIPLNHRYLSVADTIPEVPTPKFAITDIEHNSEYSLEALFRVNLQNYNNIEINVITSDPINFWVSSGIYYATVTNDITVSGIYYYNDWNYLVFRYKDNVASFIYNGEEVYSGISNSWYSPQETIKWGFYANNPTYHKYIDIKRIAVYDKWLPESAIVDRAKKTNTVVHYKLKSDLINYRVSKPFE